MRILTIFLLLPFLASGQLIQTYPQAKKNVTSVTPAESAPVITDISVSDVANVLTASYTYSDADGDLQDNYLPIASGVGFEPTRRYSGEVLNGNYTYLHINGETEGTTLYSWRRADDTSGTNEVQVGTSTTYSLTGADVGKYIRLRITPYTSTGSAGTAVNSPYSQQIKVFDPFVDITHWTIALDPSTASTDLGSSIWTNSGSGSNASIGTTSLPEWDATEGAVRFIRGNSDSFHVPAGKAFANPATVWIKFKTPASFTGFQGVLALSSTLRTFYSSGGSLTIFGVASGQTLSTNTEYVLKVKMNGTSSTFSLNGGSDTAISLSSLAGTPTVRLGCWYTDDNYFDGWMMEVLISEEGTTADEDALIKTYFGF